MHGVNAAHCVNQYPVKVKSSMTKSLTVENLLYYRMCVQLSTTCSNLLKQPNGELLVSVNHYSYEQWRQIREIQLTGRTPTLHYAVPPELHVLHTAMRAGLQITRLAALSEPRTCDLRNARPTHCLCGHLSFVINQFPLQQTISRCSNQSPVVNNFKP